MAIKFKSVEEQAAILTDLFKDSHSPITFDREILKREVMDIPHGGRVLIPHWWHIAPNYADAVRKLFTLLDRVYSKREFRAMFSPGYMDVSSLTCHPKTRNAFDLLSARQSGYNSMLFQANFCPLSPTTEYEHFFPLNVFMVGVILLTHDFFSELSHRPLYCLGDVLPDGRAGEGELHAPQFVSYVFEGREQLTFCVDLLDLEDKNTFSFNALGSRVE